MSPSTSSSSFAISRSLHERSHSLKSSSLNPQPTTSIPLPGPSNVTLFLTNLRLLELDLREDWPEITAVTFSTSARLENQKKRIHCVEWALYHLFALWSPEETRNKLQPFFPPLEPLQSLNLRAALFRCLDQGKKNGLLGRDTVLRKTMLDECKGDRLEEILAVFSNAVLKKALQEDGSTHYEAIAQRLAYENLSYTGNRSILSALILAHKVSLGQHLRARGEARANFWDFSNLLDLTDRRIVRRHEQLKELVSERGQQEKLSILEARVLQDQVERNWSGSDEWLKTILYGDRVLNQDGLLTTPIEQVWKHVENNSIGDIEGENGTGLLEQLDARVRSQENRLAGWQEFGRTVSKASLGIPLKKRNPEDKTSKIDLDFTSHQSLHIGRMNVKDTENASPVSLHRYTRLIENMKVELSEVGKPQLQKTRPPRQSLHPDGAARTMSAPLISEAEFPSEKYIEGSSASEPDEPSPAFHAAKPTSQTPPSEILPREPESEEIIQEIPIELTIPAPVQEVFAKSTQNAEPKVVEQVVVSKDRVPTTRRLVRKSPPTALASENDSDCDLADQILNSMSTATPSPPPKYHALSLAERTRISMARNSLYQTSHMHDDSDNLAELPRLSGLAKSINRTSSATCFKDDKHADLIDRTRQSMAGFEAAQKNARLERRRSMKDQNKKQRETIHFPRLDEEAVVVPPSVDRQQLMEVDPDYEIVFKSRPKINTSPSTSPTKSWAD